jgi:hypothetical protein
MNINKATQPALLCALLLCVLAVYQFHTTHAAHAQAITSTDNNDPPPPAHASNWVDTRLYFGLGPADAPSQGIPEAAWRDFLDHEVTPRFPSGLSVLDVYGQWQSPHQPAPIRIRSKLLVIDYPQTPDNTARIEAIRTAWKLRTHDQSVLKVTQPADVSF